MQCLVHIKFAGVKLFHLLLPFFGSVTCSRRGARWRCRTSCSTRHGCRIDVDGSAIGGHSRLSERASEAASPDSYAGRRHSCPNPSHYSQHQWHWVRLQSIHINWMKFMWGEPTHRSRASSCCWSRFYTFGLETRPVWGRTALSPPRAARGASGRRAGTAFWSTGSSWCLVGFCSVPVARICHAYKPTRTGSWLATQQHFIC